MDTIKSSAIRIADVLILFIRDHPFMGEGSGPITPMVGSPVPSGPDIAVAARV
jgi:hypothetical protein